MLSPTKPAILYGGDKECDAKAKIACGFSRRIKYSKIIKGFSPIYQFINAAVPAGRLKSKAIIHFEKLIDQKILSLTREKSTGLKIFNSCKNILNVSVIGLTH